jgi:adenosylcobinamide kinase/adenosylcobinamide-phosphate guanylyltransferase
MNPRLTFILGGAQSGKSRLALRLAQSQSPSKKLFLATALPQDEEMHQRIKNHQLERDSSWQTLEQPYHLVQTLQEYAIHPKTIIIVDCLTLWLSNLLCGNAGPILSPDEVENKIDEFKNIFSQLSGQIFLISNEVGLGLVPETPLGRNFRDLQGKLNQSIAQVSDEFLFVVAGIAQKIK